MSIKLNRRTVQELSKPEMDNIKGGFTYSLSLGIECQTSHSYGAKTRKQCEAFIDANNREIKETVDEL